MLALHVDLEGTTPGPPEVGLILASGLASVLYLRGFLRLRQRRCGPTAGSAASFPTGLVTLLVALISPLDVLAERALSAHMTQHLLLMMVAPPLLWLGSPVTLAWIGLPRAVRRTLAYRLNGPWLPELARHASHPAAAWLTFVGVAWAWHLPVAYEWALRHEPIHHIEHLCFLGTGLWFWWPVIQPWPARPAGPRWWILPYLALAMLANTAFSAVFTFSDRVLYRAYMATAAPAGRSALDDQAIAGAIMWVGGSLAMLVPGVLSVVRWLGPEAPRSPLARRAFSRASAPEPRNLNASQTPEMSAPSVLPRRPARRRSTR